MAITLTNTVHTAGLCDREEEATLAPGTTQQARSVRFRASAATRRVSDGLRNSSHAEVSKDPRPGSWRAALGASGAGALIGLFAAWIWNSAEFGGFIAEGPGLFVLFPVIGAIAGFILERWF